MDNKMNSNGKQADVRRDTRDFRRFIEESFPVKEVGEASAKEKNIRHGHISSLHIWWARRPLAASRATAYAALTPAPIDPDEWQKKRDFITQLCQWDNSNNQTLLERARKEILDANDGVPPKVLDPFSGGGSYPLEALRLGCESYANDYNPVAVLIEKATLEYPQKFRRPFEGMPEWAKAKTSRGNTIGKNGKDKNNNVEKQVSLFNVSIDSRSTNPLLNAVRYWSEWIIDEAHKELTAFYPADSDGSIPIGYIWARTIPCQNPACRQEIPLMRQFWLAKKENKKVSLYPEVAHGKLEFRIIGDGYDEWPIGFDPEKGNIDNAVATCLHCGAVIDSSTTRKLFLTGYSGQKMISVILQPKYKEGKSYRIARTSDLEVYASAIDVLNKKIEILSKDWGISPIPDEEIRITEVRRISLPLYGMKTWADLYN